MRQIIRRLLPVLIPLAINWFRKRRQQQAAPLLPEPGRTPNGSPTSGQQGDPLGNAAQPPAGTSE